MPDKKPETNARNSFAAPDANAPDITSDRAKLDARGGMPSDHSSVTPRATRLKKDYINLTVRIEKNAGKRFKRVAMKGDLTYGEYLIDLMNRCGDGKA